MHSTGPENRPADQSAASGLSGCRTCGQEQVSGASLLYGHAWRKIAARPGQSTVAENQILDTNWRKETKNGYDFHIDVIARPREVVAVLTDGPIAPRSRRPQAQAGQPDRRPGDDGGHFIAARFNGPGDSVNHFALGPEFQPRCLSRHGRWLGEEFARRQKRRRPYRSAI
ncbi:DNA/RNA non-specific endonuclease [Sphingobium sp. AS12]|uniref:DNA/RNA non-specific endonuclease n=1 Tax=Sphingobium sp. AS12 TaxID=2849495 RepID=UPI0034A2DB95